MPLSLSPTLSLSLSPILTPIRSDPVATWFLRMAGYPHPDPHAQPR